MKNRFPAIVKVTLISLYLIFLAGSIVRMTGSGMGCPDWPKCFGYYIPPTSEEQITWQPNSTYEEGIIIIKNEVLYVAERKVNTSSVFDETNWEEYTKHEYATFNKFHTWVEYINRLITVLSGFIFLFLLAGSLKFRKENKWIPILSFIAFFFMLVEAFLGKMVVDSNLKPTMITVHMVIGLLIIGLILRLLFIIREEKTSEASSCLFIIMTSLVL